MTTKTASREHDTMTTQAEKMTSGSMQELTADDLRGVAGGSALLLAAAGALVAAGVTLGYNVVKGGTDSFTGAVDPQQAAAWLQQHPK